MSKKQTLPVHFFYTRPKLIIDKWLIVNNLIFWHENSYIKTRTNIKSFKIRIYDTN